MVNAVQPQTLAPPPGTTTTDPAAIAAKIVADNGGTARPDYPAIKRLVDAVAATDPALGARVEAEVERALGSVKAGELRRATYTVASGALPITFKDGAPTPEQYRAMPAGSPGRAFYMRLDAAFGDGRFATDNSPQINEALRQLQTSGLSLDGFLAARSAEQASWTRSVGDFVAQFSFGGQLASAMQPVVAALGRDAGLGSTAWGAHLQRVLDTPGTARAFQAGVATGMLDGAKDFVVTIASLAGRLVQHGADTSVLGTAGDLVRSAVPDSVKDWVRSAGLGGALDNALPSAERGVASEAALAKMGQTVATYLSTRTPEQVGADIKAGIGKLWDSVAADHAKAAAQGPEAEARWFGELAGRVTFEVAATFVPVAGVAGKVAKGAKGADLATDALRAVDAATDGVKVADTTTDALRTAKTVDEAADAAALGARVAGMSLGELIEGLARSTGDDAIPYANRIAELSTHTAGTIDRVVLGKWPGYIEVAKVGGGRWYETADSFYKTLETVAGAATKEKAWLVNECFLRQQLQSGIKRIEVTSEGLMHARDPATFTARELRFLAAEAPKFGYTATSTGWVRP